ncbi:uncharacterized protein LOC128762811 [Synchiropus splendidus]|uniref:uncharacterized protein LOC128762811 n=1 Tax=Synchiropus splendidus TaxID=270530 RepID=UPI00237E6826|nr:uncharacterized protein LOC128762811 [Synchiropus splendidus]XP_053727306.1 uncharacterized protein LOC128762811 [Synchiropus splendidus]
MLILLGIFGAMASAVAGNNSWLKLDCTNDFEELMTCYFEADNCTKHSVSLQGNDGHKRCEAQRCSSGSCCCSFHINPIYGEHHQVSVWREREQLLQTKDISIKKSVKPRPPRNVSVTESNGIFQILWKNSGKESLLKSLRPQVLYRDGESQWENASCLLSTINQHSVCEMRGQGLKPSSRYWVRVRSVSSWSGLYSNWSQEVHFNSSASADVQLTWMVIGLSLSVVITIAATYWCYLQIRNRWWDSVGDCKNSSLFNLTARDHNLLNPERPVIVNLCAEPRSQISSWSQYSEKGGVGLPSPSSCSSTCSSGPSDTHSIGPVDVLARFQDALRKDLFGFNLKPQNEVPDVSRYGSYGVAMQEFNPGLVDVESRTYSIHPPNSWGPSHNMTGTSSEMIPFVHHDVGSTPSLFEGGDALTTSGHSHAQSQPTVCNNVFTVPHSDLLSPAEEGYQAFQTLMDRSSAPPVTEVQVNTTMSADHLLTQNSVQRPFLSLIHTANSPSVVLVSGYQSVPANSCV